MIALINTPCLTLSPLVTQHPPGDSFGVEHVWLDVVPFRYIIIDTI